MALGYRKKVFPVELERSPGERLKDYDTRLKLLDDEDSSETGHWCGGCHTDTCREGAGDYRLLVEEGVPFARCPLGNDIPAFLKAAGDGNFFRAYRVDAETNDIGDVTGAACPAHRLCGAGCMLSHAKRDSKHIAPTERAIFEQAWAGGWIEPIKRISNLFAQAAMTTVAGAESLQVGMIGTGVAVHRPIQTLLEFGADITAYDSKDVAGGITHWGIPGTKLDRNTYRRHTNRFEEGGARYVLNTRIGCTEHGLDATYNQMSFEALAEKSDIVFIATGLQERRWLPESQLAAEKQKAFFQGVDFIEEQNRVLDGRATAQQISHNVAGQDIVIAGGNDTAWDVVAISLRQDVHKITMIVRSEKLDKFSYKHIDKILDSSHDDVASGETAEHLKDLDKKIRGGIDKEVRSGIEEAIYIAGQRECAVRDVLDIRLGSNIHDADRKQDVEHLTIQTPSGEMPLDVDRVILALGSEGMDLKTQFGFTNDSFQMKKGGRLGVTPYYTPEQRTGILGYGTGHGGGLVGIYQTATGRKVLVFGVGDVTRDDQGLDWSDEMALIVTAHRDGINVLPDVFEAAQNRDEYISWAEEENLALNYKPGFFF
ncbi:MAG: hypothetical protein ACT4OY_04215 [Alphaproteobacteria bacterium]